MEGKNIYCCEKEELHEDAIKEVEKELPEDQLLLDLAELYKLFSDFSRVKLLSIGNMSFDLLQNYNEPTCAFIVE